MSKKIRLKFVDFWPGFNPEENFFIDVLGDSVELSDYPDILFFSNFGGLHRSFNCFKVFFSAENERPNFYETDIALTFDIISNSRHFRLPLYLLYIHRYKVAINDNKMGIMPISEEEWSKRKFCCMVVSNEKSRIRNSFYNFLSRKEKIDSGGKYLNNVGAPVQDKLEFIKNYKFVISFENSSYNGYTTEKILEPFLTNSIPVYWGNRLVAIDFNLNSFLNVRGIRDFERIYKRMKYLEKNIDEAISMINHDKINIDLDFYDFEKLKMFILKSYNNTHKNVSDNVFLKLIAELLYRAKIIRYWLVQLTIGNYR